MNSNITPEGTPVDPSAVVAPAKKSKVRRNVLLAGSAVGLVGIGSTLAANISLNGGNNVEFGQGVARTTACDEDGFTMTPEAEFDTSISKFRLTYLRISGLNLTPVGTGYGAAGYNSQSDAIAAHPGEYFDPTANGGSGDWIRTCDNVVLDFKAYTDDVNYAGYTVDGYQDNSNTAITSPIMWSQYNGLPHGNDANPGIAVKFDVSDLNDQNDNPLTSITYATSNANSSSSISRWIWLWSDFDNWVVDTRVPANSNFFFSFNNDYAPLAGSISKITVQSTANFSSDYITSDYYTSP